VDPWETESAATLSSHDRLIWILPLFWGKHPVTSVNVDANTLCLLSFSRPSKSRLHS